MTEYQHPASDQPHIKSPDNVEEEEEQEQEEVTRCICGNIDLITEDEYEDNGLFVQCDKCLVWQHGYCVGLLTDNQMPDTYHCELCRPDLHQIIQRPRKPKLSKYLGVENASSPPGITHPEEIEETEQNVPRKRRSTMNSRDAAYDRQLEAALLLSAQQDNPQPAAPPSISGRSARSGRRTSPPPPPPKRGRNSTPSPAPEEQTKKRRKKGNIKKEESAPDQPKRKRGGPAKKKQQQQQVNEPGSGSEESSRPKSAQIDQPEPDHQPSHPVSRETTPPPKKRTRVATSSHKGSVTSTPLPMGKHLAWNEMRRRVSSILDYLGRVQVEYGAEQLEWSTFLDEGVKWGYSSGKNGSMELMEGLTTALLSWESQYG